MTFRNYNALVKLSNHEDERAIVLGLKKIIFSLSLPRQKLVAYILKFLYLIANHSNANKMDADNLGVVFGLNFIRPTVETLETTLAVNKIAR